MNSDAHLVAYLAIAVWFQIILADWLGLVSDPLWKPVLVAMYGASCLGLHLVRRVGGPMPPVVPWGGTVVLAWCLLVLYGQLIGGIQLQSLVEAPSRVGLALLFVNGLLAAVIASAVLAYPLAVLYGRGAGIMAVVVAMPVFAYSAPGLLGANFRQMSSTIMGLEMVWLYAALRIAPWLVVRAVTAQATEKPAREDQ